MNPVSSVRKVLSDAESLRWSDALYLRLNEKWNLDSPCIVWDPDDCESGDEVPQTAAAHNMRYALGIQDVQDIVRNARMQKPSCGVDVLFDAFLYYYDNDAFLTLQ
jgi:hypothetical protein